MSPQPAQDGRARVPREIPQDYEALRDNMAEDYAVVGGQNGRSLDYVLLFRLVLIDVNGNKAKPDKQVNQHTEDDDTSVVKVLRHSSNLEGKNETNEGKKRNVTVHDCKSYDGTLDADDVLYHP